MNHYFHISYYVNIMGVVRAPNRSSHFQNNCRFFFRVLHCDGYGIFIGASHRISRNAVSACAE